MDLGWTDERVERLKALWADCLSANEIAAELGGFSRNAVIGKVHRLGLSGRVTRTPAATRATSGTRKRLKSHFKTPGGSKVAQQGGSNRLAPAKVIEVDLGPELTGAPPGGVGIMDLTNANCHWPIGDPNQTGFHFCGAGALAGLPYCPEHCRIAYRAPDDRRGPRTEVPPKRAAA
jgi:GcrA cell cycle regulator